MTDTEPLTPMAPHPVDRVVFSQRWSELTFLHWEVDPGLVRPHLPAGVRPDTLDGRTYVGLVPFLMRGVGVAGSPGVQHATVRHLDDTLLAAGFGHLAGRAPVSVLFSRGGAVRFGVRRPVA